MGEGNALRVSWEQVNAFRLRRHHLSERSPVSSLASVAGAMGGAQAQVLSAGQISIWARTGGAGIQDVDEALWTRRTLVRAWCMRRTLFLLPSDELATFVRGTARRPGYGIRWALPRVGSRAKLDRVLDDVADFLDRPRTRSEIAKQLKSLGYRLKSKAGGGWGDSRAVPWVEVGAASLTVGFLIHLLGARQVICSGPNSGNESTYVRADRWLRRLKDTPVEEAEDRLLTRYLEAFGPATVADFALWAGFYVRDAKEIWARSADRISQVEVGGWKAGILDSDLPVLESTRPAGPVVRLLPFFDSFVLGHRSHRNIVGEADHKKVYRAQGWVSPVVLVDGRALGVWSHLQRKRELEVRVTPFSGLPTGVSSRVRTEASDLGRFLGCPDVKAFIA